MSESRLQDHLGYWLRRLSDQVHTQFERSLAEHDVTVAQWNVLVVVYRGDATTSAEIARIVGVDPGAVSRVVDRLVEKQLMRRQPDPASRRKRTLSLTPRAEQLVPVLVEIADGNDARFFGRLSPAERRQLADILATCTRSASNERAEQ